MDASTLEKVGDDAYKRDTNSYSCAPILQLFKPMNMNDQPHCITRFTWSRIFQTLRDRYFQPLMSLGPNQATCTQTCLDICKDSSAAGYTIP